ncbi:MAG: nicotinate-nucleotide--dimethylbenzimidazole phosphoribosyltransferase, partial [Oscillospiraceae bacterium]
ITLEYLIAGHLSSEPGAKAVMKELLLSAPISAGMHLGEGTGAASLFPLLDMAVSIFNTMETFQDIKINAYENFGELK